MTRALRDKVFLDDEPVRLSICSITYNHRGFIEACIEGFLNQECDFRVEIIIYDDASTDGTDEVVRRYSEQYPSIFRTFLSKENLFSKGVNPYYSYVFPAALGEYIAICDGDDYWSDPSKLARQVALLDAEQSVAIAYGATRAVTANGIVEEFQNGHERDLTPEELKAGSPINTLTTCFRNIFKAAPPPSFLKSSPIGDLTVWGMLGYHGSGRFMADLPRANYRMHSNGVMSMQNPQKQLFMTALAQLTLAAYHAENDDMASSKNALHLAIRHINKTGVAQFAVGKKSKKSFLKTLKRWFRNTRAN
ncbi:MULTISPECIES: glycosyltransferase [Agrobacterium]|uniref:glycosyltransferase family 2 protein n=1 Tax=Agrobacterium TaxID=357 RepID=UPI001E5DA586|nr:MULTISPECIES: glycosyltransferase [Agrobacterium]UHS58219.1 glycosyltransferase [Agrobacterium vaccinii]